MNLYFDILNPELVLNKIAQDLISFEDGVIWFDNLELDEKNYVMSLLKLCSSQAYASKDIADIAISKIPLKETSTQVVLFKINPFKQALQKIEALSTNEHKKSFIAMLSVFKYCDTFRRNTQCKNGCTHSWHNIK
jgi:hypothetical protein